MATGKKIEAARKAANLSIIFMCNALGLYSESEYNKVVANHYSLSVLQQIMLYIALEKYPSARDCLHKHEVVLK